MPNGNPVDGSSPIPTETLIDRALDTYNSLAEARPDWAEGMDVEGMEILVATDQNLDLEDRVRDRHVSRVITVRRGGTSLKAGVIVPRYPKREDGPVEVDTSELDDLQARMEASPEEAVVPHRPVNVPEALDDAEPDDEVERRLVEALRFYADSERDDRGKRAREVLRWMGVWT